MKKNYFLLSASGKDRAGIVAGVAQVLFDLGGNIEDASMTRLGGEFAIMLVVGLPNSASLSKVQSSFRVLEKKFGLHLNTKAIAPALARGNKQSSPQYLLSVYGTDHPGIVFQITRALARRKVSVTDLQTKAISRAGSPLYVMLLELQVPPGLDMDEVRADLDQLRQDLKVEITLQDLEPVSL